MNIILIGEDGKLIGDVSIDQARKLAKDSNKDLIMVNAKNNTYRIADAGKLKYEQKQKEKQQRIQKRSHKIKEIQVSPHISDHDLNIKISHVKDFLSKGLKTKLVMVLKGRNVAFKDLAITRFNNIISDLLNSGATTDGPIKADGRDLIVYLSPKM